MFTEFCVEDSVLHSGKGFGWRTEVCLRIGLSRDISVCGMNALAVQIVKWFYSQGFYDGYHK